MQTIIIDDRNKLITELHELIKSVKGDQDRELELLTSVYRMPTEQIKKVIGILRMFDQ